MYPGSVVDLLVFDFKKRPTVFDNNIVSRGIWNNSTMLKKLLSNKKKNWKQEFNGYLMVYFCRNNTWHERAEHAQNE